MYSELCCALSRVVWVVGITFFFCVSFPFCAHSTATHHDAHSNRQLFYDRDIFYWAISYSHSIWSDITARISSNLYIYVFVCGVYILLLFPFWANKTLRLMLTCQMPCVLFNAIDFLYRQGNEINSKNFLRRGLSESFWGYMFRGKRRFCGIIICD